MSGRGRGFSGQWAGWLCRLKRLRAAAGRWGGVEGGVCVQETQAGARCPLWLCLACAGMLRPLTVLGGDTGDDAFILSSSWHLHALHFDYQLVFLSFHLRYAVSFLKSCSVQLAQCRCEAWRMQRCFFSMCCILSSCQVNPRPGPSSLMLLCCEARITLVTRWEKVPAAVVKVMHLTASPLDCLALLNSVLLHCSVNYCELPLLPLCCCRGPDTSHSPACCK